jgi:hypothetical protein
MTPMPGPILRVKVDLAFGMLQATGPRCQRVELSRQAVIKTLIRQALDQQDRARGIQLAAKRRAKSHGRE